MRKRRRRVSKNSLPPHVCFPTPKLPRNSKKCIIETRACIHIRRRCASRASRSYRIFKMFVFLPPVKYARNIQRHGILRAPSVCSGIRRWGVGINLKLFALRESVGGVTHSNSSPFFCANPCLDYLPSLLRYRRRRRRDYQNWQTRDWFTTKAFFIYVKLPS